VPGDLLLLAALDSGLPACAGVAVGFERLQMIFEQVDDIAKVVTFAARNADA
jgi:lysyl-tRNA synthetase class 2